MKHHIFFLIFFSVILTSCKNCNPCEGVKCEKGTCFDGECDCDDGVSRDSRGKCTIIDRDKFLGSFDKTKCTITIISGGLPGSLPNPSVTITASGAINEIVIDVQSGQYVVNGTVDEEKITIKDPDPSDAYVYSGSGNKSNGLKFININRMDTSSGINQEINITIQ